MTPGSMRLATILVLTLLGCASDHAVGDPTLMPPEALLALDFDGAEITIHEIAPGGERRLVAQFAGKRRALNYELMLSPDHSRALVFGGLRSYFADAYLVDLETGEAVELALREDTTTCEWFRWRSDSTGLWAKCTDWSIGVFSDSILGRRHLFVTERGEVRGDDLRLRDGYTPLRWEDERLLVAGDSSDGRRATQWLYSDGSREDGPEVASDTWSLLADGTELEYGWIVGEGLAFRGARTELCVGDDVDAHSIRCVTRPEGSRRLYAPIFVDDEALVLATAALGSRSGSTEIFRVDRATLELSSLGSIGSGLREVHESRRYALGEYELLDLESGQSTRLATFVPRGTVYWRHPWNPVR